ncbi:translation initiation factor IF-2 subunit beta [Candidatus Woesearchaeota archaeon]|nr:translation initiation factor IF-2 subunit beta [Candidatus Woesearchaeota archaeon]
MEEYEKLLEGVRKELPEHVFQKERFEIPKVKGHIQGNRTIINNFLQIANTLRREPENMLKFILRELATPGEIKKSGSVIIGTKVPASRINEKIRQYANTYVFCYECSKPDTKIEKDGNFSFLKCMACGARHAIKSKLKL